jgi:sec-independent protein translocase protein TatB
VFNLQGGEIVMILLLALVVLGPEKLPDAMRRAGQFYAELKKMSSSFQSEFRSVIDEPMREVRNTADMLRDSADFTKLSTGERAEKPKSAEMVAPRDPSAPEPTDQVPFGPDGPAADQAEPATPAETDGTGATPATEPTRRVEPTEPAEPTASPRQDGIPRPFASSHQRWSFDARPAGSDGPDGATGAENDADQGAGDRSIDTDDPGAAAEGRTE